MILVANVEPPEVIEPAEEPLNLPALAVAPERTSVLSGRFRPIGFMGGDEFDAVLSQPRIQGIAVIGFVPDQASGKLTNEAGSQGVVDERDFMRRSSGHKDGDRKTSAVCHGHDLATLAPLGGSHPEAPFLAITKVPSMKHSDKSSPPRVRTSSAMVLSSRSNTPERTHCWKRRWQVWYGGYRSGRSCQRAPVFSIHRIPSSIARLSRQGRPRPSTRLLGSGINDPNTAHCSFVSSTAHLLVDTRIPEVSHL